MTYKNEALQAARMLSQEDVAYCQKHYDANRCGQPERRCLIRAEFAFIEAWVYSCQYQSVLGDVSRISGKRPATENVEESLTNLSVVLESVHTIDKDDVGWCSMKQAYKIRNRITHPKSQTDLTITDGDMKVFMRAVQWFADTAAKIDEQRLTAPTTGHTVPPEADVSGVQ